MSLNPRRRDRGIDRLVGVRVIDHVNLDAAQPGGKARPIEAAGVEPQAGRIDQIRRLGQFATQAAMHSRDHQAEQIAEHRARPQRIGVGQGRALRQLGSEVVEPGRVALQPIDNLAQAGGSRDLAKPFHQLIEFVP